MFLLHSHLGLLDIRIHPDHDRLAVDLDIRDLVAVGACDNEGLSAGTGLGRVLQVEFDDQLVVLNAGFHGGSFVEALLTLPSSKCVLLRLTGGKDKNPRAPEGCQSASCGYPAWARSEREREM